MLKVNLFLTSWSFLCLLDFLGQTNYFGLNLPSRVTLNFYKQVITLIRLGWIDQDDWISQGAETGQAAILKPEVYEHKLLEINGSYRLKSPIFLLDGVGKKTIQYLEEKNLYTFNDALTYSGQDKKIKDLLQKNESLLNKLKSFQER